MKIVAFLQNQWFKDPERVKEVYARHPKHRQELNARFLFMGCLTGKRLKQAFGKLIDEIIWENASPEIGGKSSAKFKADPDHMYRIVEQERPDIVLAFGIQATEGVLDMNDESWLFDFIHGPHPASRYPDIKDQLIEMKRKLQHIIKEK